jgi:OmpA-OmpF porin, OOP family
MKLQFASSMFFMLLSFTLSAQDYRIENNEVKITAAIKFKTGTAELLPESDAALLIIKKYLDDKSYITLLRVEAHSDNAGDEKASQLLTEKRASAVCQRLISLGADCMRLLPAGFGSNKPVADNSTTEGRSENRRIRFVNATLRGKAIGGMPADGGGKTADNPCH